MKKAILITAILALVASVGGAIWFTTHQAEQSAARAAQEQAQSKPEPSKYDVGPPDPQELLELVNEERKRVGVPPLQYDANVAKSAQLKAEDMIAKDYRQHEIPGLGDMYTPHMRKLLYHDAKCIASGENYRWAGRGREDTSRSAFDGWMSSKPHREAIQSAVHQRTGFGVKNEMSVQHFCKNR